MLLGCCWRWILAMAKLDLRLCGAALVVYFPTTGKLLELPLIEMTWGYLPLVAARNGDWSAKTGER